MHNNVTSNGNLPPNKQASRYRHCSPPPPRPAPLPRHPPVLMTHIGLEVSACWLVSGNDSSLVVAKDIVTVKDTWSST